MSKLVSKKTKNFRQDRCSRCPRMSVGKCKSRLPCKIDSTTTKCPMGLWNNSRDKVCVIISARNEKYLRRTVESFLHNTLGKFEIRVMLDGWNATEDNQYKDEDASVLAAQMDWVRKKSDEDKRVIVTTYPEARGLRVAFNEAARATDAKYISKFDGHVIVSYGWNLTLKQSCRGDVIVIPRMYCLDEKLWAPKEEAVDFWYLDNSLLPQPWYAFSKREEGKGDVCGTMGTIGAAWLIEKDYWWRLGGYDEGLAFWGDSGAETSLKVWLFGGRQLVDKRAWFAHLFRTKFPYKMSGHAIEKMRRDIQMSWKDGLFPQQKYPLDWLVEKFSPVPTWENYNKQRVITKVERDILYAPQKRRSPNIARFITQDKWEMLESIVRKYSVKRVLEFGSGISTVLLDKAGVHVCSCDTGQSTIEKMKKEVSDQVRFRPWLGKSPFTLTFNYGLAFINGPLGGDNREMSYKTVAESNIPIVACHDSNRAADRKWIDLYFGGWRVIAENEKFSGMLVLVRPTTSG